MTFDGENKLVTLSSSLLGVRDLWSRWQDWWLTDDNSKYLRALDTVGGNSIDPGAGTSIPIYAFLTNGWRIRPQESSHTLNVGDGVLLVEGGGDPFVNTAGSYVVRVNYQQPVQAITVATGGSSGASAASVAEAVWAKAIEGAYTAEQLLRMLVALGVSPATGGGTKTIEFKDLANSKTRVKLKIKDADGNRNAPEILDLT
jgi:hypothetical protein